MEKIEGRKFDYEFYYYMFFYDFIFFLVGLDIDKILFYFYGNGVLLRGFCFRKI